MVRTAFALARLLTTARLNRDSVVVAHFDHRMREGSDRDQSWVASQASSWDAPYVGGAANASLTSEEEARRARFHFFEEAAAKVGARYIATGHTADDQAETILHHILRGTGLTGLAGIPRTRQLNRSLTLIRPLLSFARNEIRSLSNSM